MFQGRRQARKTQRITLGFIVLVCLVLPVSVAAKSYVYESIDVGATVQKDSSVEIQERQRLSFDGSFTQVWRDIPLKDLDAITNVRVIEGETGDALIRSDSEEPGTYRVVRDGDVVSVRWYHESESETREWVIEYTAHGAIRFLDNKDELYWNLFSDYEVPVENSAVKVRMPETVPPEEFESRFYPQEKQVTRSVSTSSVTYLTGSTAPGQALTVAVGFPKGIVSESAYWKWWLSHNTAWLASIAVALLALLAGVGRWLSTEVIGAGRGTVVAEYEPPQDLPPAMGEVIVKEAVSKKTWAATVVDLAVRGYITITEEDGSVGIGLLKKAFMLLGILPFLLFGGIFLFIFLESFLVVAGVLAAILVVGSVVSMAKNNDGLMEWLRPKHYTIQRTDKDTSDLREYERELLNTLFSVGDGQTFSTKDLRFSKSKKRELAEQLKDLKKKLYTHVADATGLYVRGPRYNGFVGAVILVAIFADVFLLLTFHGWSAEWLLFWVIAFISGGALAVFVIYEPRLTKEGEVTREKWLGFKQYLETAEKHRLENLTPEMFQRFLPYAMMFGVEKKWARAFEGLNMDAPEWHHTSGNASYAAAGSAGSFSASGFTSSFSSSFTSSLASAGASGGGASGGGGAAGGGAGGGGGGAA